MDSRYSHQDHEDKIYQLWEKAEAFNPDTHSTPNLRNQDGKNKKSPFTIIMPPPNANDPLHIGHAMFLSIEDVLIRYHRMLGDDTLWLPGTDHAGIETQFVFEKKLKKKGQSRFNFDRETLYKMIWDYVQENSDVAVEQMKKIGASADWSRFKFMLDPDVKKIILETFQKLHQDKLIYRDVRLVNYCVRCGTSYSQLEVEHTHKTSPFFTIKYGQFSIGTVRPETKFRDTALAVHPDDPRYKQYIGETFEIPGLLGTTKMKIIADREVNPEFGTGIMKVTPAHDPHDFELGQKHQLPVTPIIDFQGKMDFSWYLDNPKNTNKKYRTRAEKYHGLKVAKMREEMKKDLQEDGLLEAYDPNYTHTIGTCYRCGTVIEPLPMPQFFVKVKPMVEPILEAIKKKELVVHGAGHDKILKHWLENLIDWNISRQIVWGIRIPVWYRVDGQEKNIELSFINEDKKFIQGSLSSLLKDYSLLEIKKGLQQMTAAKDVAYQISPTEPKKGSWIQETDTFDTWFSSAQWPFTTLQTTKEGDFSRFYPTQVMETGYDILPIWVVRMLMMGKLVTGKLPFNTVYLHGLVRDSKGFKMSKSKGNTINPLETIDKFGADALRMALVIRSTAGLDKSVGDQDFKAMRNLTNKIWNAARFVITNKNSKNSKNASKLDGDFYKKLDQTVSKVSKQVNDFKIGLAAETLYNQFWHWYCDECIEQSKSDDLSHQALLKGLLVFLKLLHPFVPFVTEAVWQELRENSNSGEGANAEELLINSAWPVSSN